MWDSLRIHLGVIVETASQQVLGDANELLCPRIESEEDATKIDSSVVELKSVPAITLTSLTWTRKNRVKLPEHSQGKTPAMEFEEPYLTGHHANATKVSGAVSAVLSRTDYPEFLSSAIPIRDPKSCRARTQGTLMTRNPIKESPEFQSDQYRPQCAGLNARLSPFREKPSASVAEDVVVVVDQAVFEGRNEVRDRKQARLIMRARW